MRRREFIALLGGAANTWPIAAVAQSTDRIRRIGVLMSFTESEPEAQSLLSALFEGFQGLSSTKDRNARIDVRFGAGDAYRRSMLARELIELNPDVIVTGGTPATMGVWQETRVIPIVFVQIADPVELGLFVNLAHPGGNITGFTIFEFKIGGKWVELLREVAPSIARVAVVVDTQNPSWPAYLRAIEPPAEFFGVQVTRAGVHEAAEIEQAIDSFASEPNGGLIVLPSPASQLHHELIIGLAAQHRLPAVYPYRFHAESGGLISYGVVLTDIYHRAASYVDRILRGERPSDLPVQAPTKFELVVNLRTAKASGFTIPAELLARADEVIE